MIVLISYKVPKFSPISTCIQDTIRWKSRQMTFLRWPSGLDMGIMSSLLCHSDWLMRLQVFMNLINRIFRSLLDQFVILFIDDILFYSKRKEKHAQYLTQVLQVLRKKKLYTKLNKCWFWLEHTSFIRHMVSKDGVFTNSDKINTMIG